MAETTFSRFKYAEEFAFDRTRERKPWTMTVEYDVSHDDDGEEYIYDEFKVTWDE